jgi:alkanesulfonate monooxygenase SsuD/methylene tetrahydromethanopterin reductase-like flavin-dependent oxidoreductase (luciferase family)
MAITSGYADWSPERSRSFALLRKFNLDRPPFGRPGRKPAKISRQKAAIMKFGLFCSAQANSGDLGPETGQGFRDYLDFNVEAEALGFRSSFLVEHHFTGWNQVSSTLMLLMALAMRTKTLRLGSAVMVLPWHNPVLLAEQAATLDLISGGRFDFGVGKGYRHSEFKGFQIAPEEAEARFEEAIEVIKRAFTERRRFSHRGRFWHFEDIVVEPPPAQQPHPPFWVAAGSEASIRRAAARGFNLILDQYASAAQIGERIAIYKAERKRNGLSFDPMQVVVARQLYVAKSEADKQAALARQAAYTKRTVDVSRAPGGGKPGSHVLAYADKAGGTEENALFGTPDEICAMLEALQKAGADYVLLTVSGGVAQLRRFATEIMPALARSAPAADAAE